MPEEVKKLVTYDVDGYDIVTKALEIVLNTFPGLQPTEKIKFSSLKEDEAATCTSPARRHTCKA